MSKLTLQIPGSPDDDASAPKLGGGKFADVVKTKSAQRFRVQGTRAGDKGSTVSADSDDIVELELEGGVHIWTTVAQLQLDYPGAFKRSAANDTYTVPLTLPIGVPPGTDAAAARGARGIGDWALKALRIVDVDVAGASAKAIAQKLESKLEPGPGLYRIGRSDAFTLTAVSKLPNIADKPLLVFIHGTGSNTRSSFADLWHLPDDKRSAGDIGEDEKRELREQLYGRYGEHVYALEHRTLSESPIENALALAQALPENARLHLVSHSRGGLVGELLCRAAFAGRREPFSSDDIALFADGESDDGAKIDRSRDRKALSDLNKELKNKRIKVERFVRVACPARGTTLASGRLDRWLSVVVNLFDQIPGFGSNPIYDFTTSLMLAVIKKRTDPSELPGLEAMMPRAPLIRILNIVADKHDADLSVISGDVEGASLLERLKFLVTDWFYQQDHDLVVDTISMTGGAPREAHVESAAKGAAGSRKFFERGARVTHFRYFRNPESVRKLYAGLLRRDGDDAGFEPLSIDYHEIAARSIRKRSRAAAEARPIVFLVPGIMGSHLEVRGNRIWMDLLDLAAGGMASLRIDAKQVSAEAIMGASYAKLVDFLGDTHEVITFPYDWRRPLADAADDLAAAIQARLAEAERIKQPISVLAHSMGGLITRTMIARHADIWSRMGAHAQSRLIMLGTPNGGSYSIPVMLTARDPLVRKLALLDLGHNHAELQSIIARFPGALQMLPVQTRWDFFDPAFWTKLAEDDHGGKDKPWSLPVQKDLDEARSARNVLDASPIDPQRMLYVAGCAEATPFDLEFAADAAVGKRLRFQATARGDGRVPWETGIPPGVRTWYMDATHGDLADHEEAFPALLELLQQGATTRLATTPPAVRGALTRFELPEAPEPAVLPDEEDLAAAALGASRRVRKAAAKPRITVAVLHGNLAYTSNVVAVGHYEGDTIVSAERYLDRQLDGKLSACQQLGLYPGRPDTAEIFLDPKRKPSGAIVVGLGQVGQLTPGDLSKSVKRGVLMYASSVAERVAAGAATESIEVASLLIGTGAGGIAIGDSLLAILRGYAQAADALRATQYKDRVRLDRIEFIELYEDRAIQAARALSNATRDAEFQARYTLVPEVEHLPSGRRRVAYDDDPNWWRRLQILGNDAGLQFNTLTDRARVEVQLQATQRALVDEFLAQAITETRTDNALGSALFELLLPNRLKEQAPNQEHVVLLVNDASARYPWELLIDQRGGAERPLSVQAGMIRQLQTEEFREVVNTATRDSALVVGDPDLGAAEQLFPSLDGAKREAELVAELLGKQGMRSVTSCVRQSAPSIVRALFAQEYKILHLAGHGVYEFDLDAALDQEKTPRDPCKPARKVTGMLIGDGVFLTPAEVKQMRSVPELVFINCCHLGRVEHAAPEARRDRHKLAANLATEFIRMGVKAVVAAGWEVDDAAAAAFAAKFYDEMWRGTPFGEAVLAARSSIFNAYPSVNTWGAYQCYGDHAYRMRVQNAGTALKDDPEPHFVAGAEAAQELDNLAADAKTATASGRKWLLGRIKAIHKYIESRHERWLTEPSLQAALGRAYAELDEFAQAIACYRRALEAERATYPLATLEQLANLQVRYAAALYRTRQAAGAAGRTTPKREAAQLEDPSELIKSSVDLCETLLRFGDTSERLSVLASAYKRRAFIDPLQRGAALSDMVRTYRRADELARKRTGASNPYPLLNALAGEAVLKLVGGKTLGDVTALLQPVREAAREEDFWGWLRDAECALIEGLAQGDLAKNSAVVIDGYTGAIKRAASPREARSVRENLELLIAALDDAPKHARNKRLGAQLRKILEAVSDKDGIL